jgi:hypothetical protein
MKMLYTYWTKSVLRIYRREKFVRLSADIKWIDYSSTAQMRKHLVAFVCNEKPNFKKNLEGTNLSSLSRVEIKIKCGKVANRSSFAFLRCPKNKSRIIGVCSTNKLVDLIEDFDFLREQMNKSNITFTLGEPKIFIDNNELFVNVDKTRLRTKSILADFLGTFGFISGAISYLILGEFSQITLIAFIMGMIFWLASIIFGSGNKTKYVLIEQE